MARKKKQHSYRPFETTGAGGKYVNPDTGKTRTESFSLITESMLYSAAFQSLENRQKMLYVYMKGQLYGRTTSEPRTEYPDAPGLDKDVFFFTWSMAKQTGLYKDGSRAIFSRDVKALVQKGFISIVYQGEKNGRKSIYQFSGNWKNAPF